MAVTVDTSTENVRTGTTSPQTFSHAGASSGVKGVVLAIVHGTSSTDHVSAASYGGTAMQRIVRATDTATEPGAAEIWFLGASVPQGTQTVSYTCGSTTDDIHAVCTTLLAAEDLIAVDFDSVSDNAANPSVTLQYGGRTGMAFAALYGGGADGGSFTPNGNCTTVHDHDLGAFYSEVIRQTTGGTADFAIGGTSSSDDVAYVAIAACEKQALTMPAGQGSYSLSGQAQTLRDHPRIGEPAPLPWLSLVGGFSPAGVSYNMPAAQGSYSLSGQTVPLKADRRLTFAQGSYSLSGQTAGLSAAIIATQGSYTLSGQAAALRADRILAFAQGDYALSGQAATLTHGYPMSAVQGSYSLDGQAASLTYGHPMAGAQGSYTLSGQAVALTAQRTLAFAQGSYSLNGQEASLTYDAAERVMPAEQGSYTLAGQTVNLRAFRPTAEQGAYSLAGQTVNLVIARTVAAEQGSYSLSGQAAELKYSALALESGAYVLSGQDVALSYDAAEQPEAPAKGGGTPGLTRKQFKEHLERIRRERDPGVQAEVFAGEAESTGQVFVFAPVTERREAVVIPAPIKVRKSRKRRDEEELLMGLLD